MAVACPFCMTMFEDGMAKALAVSMSQTRQAVATRMFLGETDLEVLSISREEMYKDVRST